MMKVSCTICKTVTTLDPRETVAGLPDASFLLNLKDEDADHLKETLIFKKCGVCEDRSDIKASAECQDCGDYLCSDCAACHTRTKFTRGHRVVSLWDTADENYNVPTKPGNEDNKMGTRSILAILDEEYENEHFLSTIEEQDDSDKSSEHSDIKSSDTKETEDESKDFTLCASGDDDENKNVSNPVQVQDEGEVFPACSNVSLGIEGAVDQLHRKARELTSLMQSWQRLEEAKVQERNEVEADVDDFSQRLEFIIGKQRSWLQTETDIVYSRVCSDVASAREGLEKRLCALHYVTQFLTALSKYGNPEQAASLRDCLAAKIAELLSSEEEVVVAGNYNEKIGFEPDKNLLSQVTRGIGKLKHHKGNGSVTSTEESFHNHSESDATGKEGSACSFQTDCQSENVLAINEGREDSTSASKEPERLLWVIGHGEDDDDIKFNNPCGLVVTKAGDVIVADQGNRRLVVLNKNGKFKTKVGLDMSPNAVVMNSEGQVAVTGTKGEGRRKEGEVQVWKLHRKREHELVVQFGAGILKNPHGVAVDSQGRYVVADVGKHRVTVHRSDGGTLMSFGEHGDANDQFYLPYYVAVTSSDDIVVSDEFQKCLKVFNSRGRFLRRIGPRLKREVHLECPGGLCVMNDVILVVDIFTGQVMSISLGGKYQGVVLSQKDGLSYPQTLAVGPGGLVAVTEGSFFKGTHCVKTYRLGEFATPYIKNA
ncbi:PREDICTED: tripartite motif-containing protein 2-like [Branchiostoma belcheri]|uniref:Tripartite motif-containing protein 2-like n=1 Tax=Branchiostoma belcheri TaxID=7741 RepID=A0A6P5A644_BRABE|nr:PREDICTED: tripartite motif-containing protein 2-like [Branchiostoma belcheri]